MLTLKGSILGIVVFFAGMVLVGCLKMYQVSSAFRKTHPAGGELGWDVVTMYHNNPLHRDPLLWIALIVFMAGGSWLLRH